MQGTLWRASRHAPWYYCDCGECRFDLDDPRGTCYLGTDELVGVLESIGPEIHHGVIAAAYLDQRRLHRWRPSRPLTLADLANRRALGSGVTNELSTMTPFTVPRAWARAFDRSFAGIVYRTRFDTGETARGVAHFGARGLARRKSGAGRVIDASLRDRLENECGVVVAPAARSDQLDYAPDPRAG